MITNEKLNKMDKCRHLLPDPAPEVVGELIEEIRRSREGSKKMDKIKCFLGFHDWKVDTKPVNAVLWRFCERCGQRQSGTYDMCWGETVWKNR